MGGRGEVISGASYTVRLQLKGEGRCSEEERFHLGGWEHFLSVYYPPDIFLIKSYMHECMYT